jgi:carbamoyl-phosphate synthase large subunit
VEEAGIHSGDSCSILPPHTLSKDLIEEIKRASRAMAEELGVIGLMNVQFAVKDQQLYVLEVNPRASRTVPFVSKATGVPLAKLATKVMMGATLKELGLTTEVEIKHWAVKESVFPFDRFDKVDTLLGPEMKSTGEVMGIDDNLGLAIVKSHLAAGSKVPSSGNVFISVRDNDKAAVLSVAEALVELEFSIYATTATAAYLKEAGVPCELINKISQGRPHILDKVQDGQISWIINTSLGRRTTEDSYLIRRAALDYHIPYTTTVSGAAALVKGIRELKENELVVHPVQYFTQAM